ncbi:hypothetical protein ACH3VR_21435 [Microbacterium sp. B2969]|uniref:Uncharacterized protein n=1 Tax=Microbacterium alkaliflavum TaxID=3248839 RepID=A0ABW7QFP0_9MICO
MRTLAEAEAVARAAIRRRRSREHAQRVTQSAEDASRRLQAAQAVVDARKHREAAVQAVLHTPRRLPMRAWPGWLDTAMASADEYGDAYMIWST